MRALREILGGLSLAFIALCTVVGGLFLALNESGALDFVSTASSATTPPVSTPTLTTAPPTAAVTATPSAASTRPAILQSTAARTSTHTRSPAPALTPTQAPTQSSPHLQITHITLLGITRDSLRPNGAIATVRLEHTGGVPPYNFYDNDILQVGNPFRILTHCGGALIHTIRITSADNQTDSQTFALSPVVCP